MGYRQRTARARFLRCMLTLCVMTNFPSPSLASVSGSDKGPAFTQKCSNRTCSSPDGLLGVLWMSACKLQMSVDWNTSWTVLILRGHHRLADAPGPQNQTYLMTWNSKKATTPTVTLHFQDHSYCIQCDHGLCSFHPKEVIAAPCLYRWSLWNILIWACKDHALIICWFICKSKRVLGLFVG